MIDEAYSAISYVIKVVVRHGRSQLALLRHQQHQQQRQPKALPLKVDRDKASAAAPVAPVTVDVRTMADVSVQRRQRGG